MLSSKDYTVGWICNIITEYVAAQAVIDEEHERPEDVAPSDSSSYTLGKIGKHNVVMTVLPSGDISTSSAAIVASRMLHSFPNIAFFLTVVVGGGAPSLHHDIRLGDVVVGVSLNGEGGVYQHDLDKTIQDEEIYTTGVSRVSPPILRTAVNELIAQYESKGHQLERHINNILEMKPRLRKKYMRPGPDSDRLFDCHFTHPKDEANCFTCGYESAHMVLRCERPEEEDNPAIHYGLIASGNQVMRDALTRARLAETKGVLCFAVGCAGVMNHFPCLVIVGICNYADTHKSREWQGYAALAAAVYAKDLLRQIHPSKIETEEKIEVQEKPLIIGSHIEISWGRRKPTPRKEIVKIAILDTGIDLDHPKFKPFRDDGRISGGYCRDFVTPGESPIRDSTGHGTHCAHLILKVCQTARLYVAKVFETDVGDEKAVERIPEAVDWAVNCGVDIIVMCFAFTRFHSTIYKAICEAKGRRDVLIFAAASNNKHDLENPVGFPACIDEVIRVNSCTHKGLQSSFSPTCHSERSSLSIIGEELQAAFPLAKNGNEPLKRMTGTSGQPYLLGLLDLC
ncbi:Subtilisin DY [Trichoderma lentiforme]|uniref:Subtilisin DY n=1 Tax=Trichoderma lentiforme TaxID=1567552 RepID=A0A9P5CDZ2_9HYPO|nr:Subtilisin DY [Trichoderma lentiforme]